MKELTAMSWGIKAACWIVFFLAMGTGYGLSLKHPLANDELFTQTSSIEKQSYLHLLTMKIPEGNVSPLFYLTQKVFLDILGFQLPFEWNGDWFVTDHCSQIIMRILSNLWMSLAITSIFIFFTRAYSLMAGTYAFLVAISSYMTWAYWVEARPYALWYFLSTVHVLTFLKLMRQRNPQPKTIILLGVIQYLLSLTVVLSVVQIAATTLVLAWGRKISIRSLALTSAIPMGLCFLYYWGSPKYAFCFIDSPLQLFSANLPKDRLLLMIGLGGIGLWRVWKKEVGGSFERLRQSSFFNFMIFMGFILVGNVAILALFYIKAHGQQDGFPISNRYLTALTPAGIVAVVYLSLEVWNTFQKHLIAKSILMIVLISFLGFRLVRTWELVRGYFHLT